MKSMTGYGKADLSLEGIEVTVEIKSVNNRYLDVNFKLPRALLSLEEPLRKIVSSHISRGRVDAFVTCIDNREGSRQIDVDFNLAKGYVDAAEALCQRLGLQNDLTVTSLLKTPDVVRAGEDGEDLGLFERALKSAITSAVESLDAMRSAEGDAIKRDIEARLKLLKEYADRIKERAPLVAAEYREKLAERMKEALAGIEYDEARLLAEVAFFADRSNIDEELTRLYSHYKQLKNILSLNEPVGRKLDFLVQELNREANTICSKSNDSEITRLALELKSGIEKIREQVQNVE
jgi:uncharacterized protein (TIGR00255 family)